MTFPSKGDTTLSAWAHAYAEAGWPVFPLIPKDKRPIPLNGFKAASTDHDLIDAWWSDRPNANIGVATGHGFDVLDVDGDIGVEFLRNYWAERGLDYRHAGPISLTGKGWHMLFAPTGNGNGANLGGDGEKGPDGKLLRPTKLDFRGIGGYIAAPPSIHPLGHRYTWDDQRGPALTKPPAPDWLTSLLSRDDNPIATPKPNGPRKVIVGNTAYETLIENGVIPRDQLPRGTRTRLERPDILEVCAQLGLQLRKRTHYYVSRCPFHQDDTPSMAVYPSNNTFYCYGCFARGDSYDLRTGKHL